MAAKRSTRKTAGSRPAAETTATPAGAPARTARTATTRAGTKRGGTKRGEAGLTRVQRDARTPTREAGTPGALARARAGDDTRRASADDYNAVRRGDAKPDNKLAAPRPDSLGIPLVPLRDEDGNVIPSPNATVVDITARTRKIKGFRQVDVVATRMGYYGLRRRRAGEVFPMGLVGDGYLPSWVRVADNEDKDPEVSRSRQVVRNSTAQEIIDDVEEDAGTEVPTYLGGNQRRPTNQSGDVL